MLRPTRTFQHLHSKSKNPDPFEPGLLVEYLNDIQLIVCPVVRTLGDFTILVEVVSLLSIGSLIHYLN